MKKRILNFIINIILIFIFLVGLSLLLYPTVSDYWNSLRQSAAITGYSEQVAALDEERYAQLWQAAQEYNAELAEHPINYLASEEQTEKYNELLNIGGNGVMSYIEIPIINCSVPIYHGTSDEVLQVAIGHLDWSSLPIGGESTHCVVSGHRGLPSARLFTDLDKMVIGDIFMLRTLDEVLTYEVDQIRIVEPHETQDMEIQRGEDYCTLVTCTPYGINSHRLLVRGRRIENTEDAKVIRVTADAIRIDPLIVAAVLSVLILLILLILLLFRHSNKNNKPEEAQKAQKEQSEQNEFLE